jgi:serine/threonine protein kinase
VCTPAQSWACAVCNPCASALTHGVVVINESSTRELRMAEITGKTLGPFEIIEEIGRGGMAIVYKAWQPTARRNVALKVLPPELALDPALVRRFQVEAEAAARLEHPNIVRIYQVGQADGAHYMAMEYLEGRDLAKLIAREGALPTDRVARIAKQIGAALDHAHAQGYIHRDVKPSNIIVGAGDHVTLTDFGIVRIADGTRLTRTGMLVGTPAYMSPEQVRGQDVDRRTDVYSLGIVCYEMLTGRVPFAGETPAVLHAQAYETPAPLRRWVPSMTRGVEAVVIRALDKDKEKRYASAGALADALARAIANPAEAETELDERPIVLPKKASAAVAKPVTKRDHSRAFQVGILAALVLIWIALGTPGLQWLVAAAKSLEKPTSHPTTARPVVVQPTQPPDAVANTPGEHLLLRAGAGKDFETIDRIPDGEWLTVVAYDPQYPDYLRVRRSNGQVGWVTKVYTTIYCDLRQKIVPTVTPVPQRAFRVEYHGCVPHDMELGCVKGQVFARDGQVIVGALVEIDIGGQRWDSPANPAATNGAGWYEWNLTAGQKVKFLSLTVDGSQVPFEPSGFEVVTQSGCFQHVDFIEQ